MGATPAEIGEIQHNMRTFTPTVTRGFQLEYWNPNFREEEIVRANARIFFLTGGYYLGKTTIMRTICESFEIEQIPEVKTRPLREGEVQGREIESVSEGEFKDLMSGGELLIAYRANLGQRRHWVGIRRESFERAIERNGCTGIIVHPNAVMTLLQKFWIKTVVLLATKEERRYYRTLRGVTTHDSKSQDITGSFSTESVYLPQEITLFVHNLMNDQYAVAKTIAAAVIMPDIYQVAIASVK